VRTGVPKGSRLTYTLILGDAHENPLLISFV
jgi:hypothetical protein